MGKTEVVEEMEFDEAEAEAEAPEPEADDPSGDTLLARKAAEIAEFAPLVTEAERQYLERKQEASDAKKSWESKQKELHRLAVDCEKIKAGDYRPDLFEDIGALEPESPPDGPDYESAFERFAHGDSPCLSRANGDGALTVDGENLAHKCKHGGNVEAVCGMDHCPTRDLWAFPAYRAVCSAVDGLTDTYFCLKRSNGEKGDDTYDCESGRCPEHGQWMAGADDPVEPGFDKLLDACREFCIRKENVGISATTFAFSHFGNKKKESRAAAQRAIDSLLDSGWLVVGDTVSDVGGPARYRVAGE